MLGTENADREHRAKSLGSVLTFLKRYSEEGDDFLSHRH